MPATETSEAKQKPKTIWSTAIWPLLETLAIAILLVTFVFTTVGISGDSMVPTLMHGERAFVPKYETWLHRAGVGGFQHGDIVFFRPPEGIYTAATKLPLLGINIEQYFIKRIVATEGDRIRMEAGVVYVNDQALDQTFDLWQGSSSFSEQSIPEDHVFVLGDNRTPLGSVDSRQFGPVPTSSIAGRASHIIWPLTRRSDEGLRWNMRGL
jgi:signal peptidase I